MPGRRSLGPAGKGADRPCSCLVAKNYLSLKILEMEVLRPLIHALEYWANVCCTTQNTSQHAYLGGGACGVDRALGLSSGDLNLLDLIV